jgi:NAD(P)-dependent dehydrogenase (short-subunit alcohol dehydrogenase family)
MWRPTCRRVWKNLLRYNRPWRKAAEMPDSLMARNSLRLIAKRWIQDVERLKNAAYDKFGKVDIIMNNAAIGGKGSANWTGLDAWHSILDQISGAS